MRGLTTEVGIKLARGTSRIDTS